MRLTITYQDDDGQCAVGATTPGSYSLEGLSKRSMTKAQIVGMEEAGWHWIRPFDGQRGEWHTNDAEVARHAAERLGIEIQDHWTNKREETHDETPSHSLHARGRC